MPWATRSCEGRILWPSHSVCYRCRGKAGQLLAVPDLLNLSKPTSVTPPKRVQRKPAGPTPVHDAWANFSIHLRQMIRVTPRLSCLVCCRCRGKAGQLLAVPDLLNLSKPTSVTAPKRVQRKPAGACTRARCLGQWAASAQACAPTGGGQRAERGRLQGPGELSPRLMSWPACCEQGKLCNGNESISSVDASEQAPVHDVWANGQPVPRFVPLLEEVRRAERGPASR